VRDFGPTRDVLLAARVERQKRLDAGELPDFAPSTANIRQADWRVAPIPADLRDRRVEITGPVDRKMVINALNSGASVFMADFEDAKLADVGQPGAGPDQPAGRRSADHLVRLAGGQEVRAEGQDRRARRAAARLAPVEKHVLLDGKPIPASLFDFGLYLFHNAKALLDRGTGPYFYLPKLESHLEPGSGTTCSTRPRTC